MVYFAALGLHMTLRLYRKVQMSFAVAAISGKMGPEIHVSKARIQGDHFKSCTCFTGLIIATISGSGANIETRPHVDHP